jgi:hypothetical protein
VENRLLSTHSLMHAVDITLCHAMLATGPQLRARRPLHPRRVVCRSLARPTLAAPLLPRSQPAAAPSPLLDLATCPPPVDAPSLPVPLPSMLPRRHPTAMPPPPASVSAPRLPALAPCVYFVSLVVM